MVIITRPPVSLVLKISVYVPSPLETIPITAVEQPTPEWVPAETQAPCQQQNYTRTGASRQVGVQGSRQSKRQAAAIAVARRLSLRKILHLWSHR